MASRRKTPSNGSSKKTPRLKSTSSRRRLKMNFDDDGKLVDKDVIIEPPKIPEPTEQEKNLYSAIEAAFQLGDDAAKAIARFERDVVYPRYRANDESEEEFRRDDMETVCYHLGRLHMIKAILPLYGLEAYEREILAHFVDKAFGSLGKGPSKIVDGKSLFRGDDDAYLQHMAMTRDTD